MTVAGIDYDGTGVFIVLADEDTGGFHTSWHADLACGPGEAFERARRVRHLMPPASAWDSVLGVAIELPFSRFAGSLVPLMRVQGAILASLPRHLDVVELRPQTWKKRALGKSNASKAEIRAWALDEGMHSGWAVDFYDAYGLARAYLAIRDQPAAEAA